MSYNVLVTGGAGFLGSHLCDRLLADMAIEKVHCLDNLQTGSVQNFKHIERQNRFSFTSGDVIDQHEFDVKEVWNLACAASPPKYQIDPIHTFKTSVFGSYHLAKTALENQAKFFQASTSEVYGDPLISPQLETHWGNVNPIGGKKLL